MQKYILVILFVLVKVNAHANLRCEVLFFDARLRSDSIEDIQNFDAGPGFIVPNEHQLGKHRETFAQFSEGIYLTVGTERGLVSSAFTNGKIKALIQVDRDPKVVLFNRVNRALLAASKSREHYLNLRLKSTYADWLKLLEHSNDLSTEDRGILANRQAWQWWQDKVQNLTDWKKFHQDPILNEDQSYLHANYLFDDGLFAQVVKLAKQRRIIVILDSLGTETLKHRVDAVAEAMHLKISAIDMSNAWQQGYLGHENTIRFLNSFKSEMNPDTKIVFTYLAKSDSRYSTASIFKYLFAPVSSYPNLGDLSNLMAGMARSEPSQQSSFRSRASRFDDF